MGTARWPSPPMCLEVELCAEFEEPRLQHVRGPQPLAGAGRGEPGRIRIRPGAVEHVVEIEVEADTLDQVHAFLEIDGIDVILLDNMKPAQIREAIALGKGKVKFEASGGVTLKNIRQIAATGVDYISIGALTHSPRSIDFSLEITHVDA